MTLDQIYLLCILGAVLVLFVWGRLRHDVVAILALSAVVVAGQVSPGSAFSGFANPATVTVALVLVISRGLQNSGAVSMIARNLMPPRDSLTIQIGSLSSLAGALSSFMNNVGALAMLMPAAIKSAQDTGRSPSLLLMPLAFGSILGGLVTLIGTPPNLIIASFREEMTGQSFSMFDFTPVGLAVAAAGIAFISLAGWRMMPKANGERTTARELFQLDNFITEAEIPEGHPLVGKSLRDADELVQEQDAIVLGILRANRRIDPAARRTLLRENDVLLIEAGPEEINATLSKLNLRPPLPPETELPEGAAEAQDNSPEKPDVEETPSPEATPVIGGRDVAVIEAVVQQGSKIINKTSTEARLRALYGMNLLGVARAGQSYRGRIRDFRFKTGDVMLVEGEADRLTDMVMALGCLPLSERPIRGSRIRMAWLALGFFLAAILATTFNLLSFPIALSLAVCGMIFTNIIPAREIYDDVDWSVVVLLGAMIPVGQAMQQTGTTDVLASGLGNLVQAYDPAIALTVIMILTILLTNVINNAATAVVMAPVAIDLATKLNVSQDCFLMAVAVGASCAFLTPIGHQNNALVMGPGGYKFGDFWRMGLPLEFVVVIVAIPMLLWVWPL